MAESTPETTKATARPARPINILIVDDSSTMRMVLRRIVDLTDVPIGTVYEAVNGREALKILETCDVDALFTDINMPVMSGYELLLAIAREPRWNQMLRIVVSTDGSELRQEEVREAHVSLYITKPFRPEAVRNVLSRITHVGRWT